LAILTAILRASSFVSSLAAESRIIEIDIGELPPGAVFHDEGGANVLGRPGRREAASGAFGFLIFTQCRERPER
jgi:hypothetical protein